MDRTQGSYLVLGLRDRIQLLNPGEEFHGPGAWIGRRARSKGVKSGTGFRWQTRGSGLRDRTQTSDSRSDPGIAFRDRTQVSDPDRVFMNRCPRSNSGIWSPVQRSQGSDTGIGFMDRIEAQASDAGIGIKDRTLGSFQTAFEK